MTRIGILFQDYYRYSVAENPPGRVRFFVYCKNCDERYGISVFRENARRTWFIHAEQVENFMVSCGNCGRKMSEGHERLLPGNESRTQFETMDQFIAALNAGRNLFG